VQREGFAQENFFAAPFHADKATDSPEAVDKNSERCVKCLWFFSNVSKEKIREKSRSRKPTTSLQPVSGGFGRRMLAVAVRQYLSRA
jgi:hypothetical protein